MNLAVPSLKLQQLSALPLRYLALPLMILSALGVVGIKHHSRGLQTQAQALAAEREQLEVEFNQLRLERGYVGAHSRVGELAEKQLGMKVPDDNVIVQVPGQE